ncbi:MAG: hypothetical protein SV375_21195, partial [Thermodesulfobacteriota bacterium]|nr:hypothetical protein [Thermodesulfobacteriota bacterium]
RGISLSGLPGSNMMERQTRLAALINKHLSFGTNIARKNIPQAREKEGFLCFVAYFKAIFGLTLRSSFCI